MRNERHGKERRRDLPEAACGKYVASKNAAAGSGVSIQIPDGRKVHLAEDEMLLIVNGKPKYTAKAAADVLTAIRHYADERGWRRFVVNDIRRSKKVPDVEGLPQQSRHLLFFSIEKVVARSVKT